MKRRLKRWVFSIGAFSVPVALGAQPAAPPLPATRPSSVVFQSGGALSPTTQPATQPAIPERAPNGHASSSHAGGNELADLSLDDLMNVEVTSVSKQPQRIADAPASITVIGQNDIQRSGLNTIPDLLRLAPGMNVARVNANTWAISARGFNSQLADDLLVLMDGRSIYTPTLGGVFWDTVDYPLNDLDRIEVIRGPGATLWGSNAVNGVVNIITKPADQTQGLSLESRIGTDESNSSIRYGGQIDDLTFFRVYAKYGYTGSQTASDGDSGHDQYDTLHSGFRIDRYTSPTDTLTLQGDVNEQQIKETYLGVLGGDSQGDAYDHGGNMLARWTHTASEQESTSLQIDYTRQDEILQPAGFDEADYNLDFQNRFPLGDRQEITWGAGARENQISWDAPASAVLEPKNRSLYLINGFIQDQVSIVPDRVQFSLGTKLEYDNLAQFEFDPSARLAWTPDKQNTIWAAVSRSTRIPSLYQDTRDTFGILSIRPDNPSSEKTVSYELGYKVQPCKTVTLDATGFYSTYRDLILSVPSAASPLNQSWINAAMAQSAGAELAASWQVTPQWKLAGSYSLLKVVAASSVAGVPNSSIQAIEGSSPENQFQIHSYYDLTRSLQLNGSAYYVQGLPKITGDTFRDQDVGSYLRLDLGMTWKPRDNMSFSVGVQNLLQKRHAESGDLGLSLVPSEVPRSVYAQFQMTF
jgi:iron complex outermembrane receptor protein